MTRHLKLCRPNLRTVLIEKEAKLAAHQGHNSGVLHAGIYYAPGSLKARLCVQGIDMAYEYCDLKGIPYKKCGKLIVAVDKEEISRLENLFDRAQKNNCKNICIVNSDKICEIEPYCQDFKQMGGDVELEWTLKGIEETTPTIYGDVLLGPNAVLALSREGYNKTDFLAKDFFDSIKFKFI
ncbi:DAO domain-containing protein [Meloidogyne graminicola]|uniref:L-2-hydroxyglutarate dehydrogenase, mitochondrial n=1 Tax=Meloidogyne graminicola TaxID=189291 RepID=A0A8S9ZHS8_9BILA|nr:DAO domain-containing protein [Meloidogyne graminicola]